ncbi:hypothetical protein CRE_16234 [Caenorhabditis remanei]|uniref:C2H2-type domain-containing protein n=1 Tax=Caenorhabditis remanei TaxID=31234 RepID=E3MSP9_CAERE|nr:hypothetical protein CRE_16234 [Caenorhabditis remanei]
MEQEEEIDVVNFDASIEVPAGFQCDQCEWVGKSERSLGAHRRHKHPKPEGSVSTPRGRGRPRKEEFDSLKPAENEVIPARVTTKQLLGGRKRPKTIVDSIDDSALRTDREASRLHDLGIIDEATSVGEFVRRDVNYPMVSNDMMMMEEGGSMVVGEEVIIDNEEENGDVEKRLSPMKPRVTPSRRFTDKVVPDRLIIGDVTGKYKCYIPDCGWKGGYRSIRMDHMKAIHPEWKKPARFILERISKDGVYLDPDAYVPPFACNVPGCTWRGNYRASRSVHMKKVHPNEHAERKKSAPGYNSNGTYACHYPGCTWKGWSRSTRSMHLKKAHPDWRPEDSRVLMILSCFFCKSTFPSYPLLSEHISTHGGVGLHVEEFFETKELYSVRKMVFFEFLQKYLFQEWMIRIEKLYSLNFERYDPPLHGDHGHPDGQIYLLHCSCVGHRGAQLAVDARAYIYDKHHFLKRRPHQLMTRHKNDCSAFLEIREESEYGPVHVKGTLEHTGHRFGTPLLRMTSMERQLFCDVTEWKSLGNDQFMAMDVVEKLTAYEGFLMDNFSEAKGVTLMEPLDMDPLLSVRILVEQSEPSCFFGVNFSEFDNHKKMSFGYMNLEMQKIWGKFGPGGTVCIDMILMDFDEIEMVQYTVYVIGEQMNIPKCVMLYMTTEQASGPPVILEHLTIIDARSPKEFLTNPSEIWVELARNTTRGRRNSRKFCALRRVLRTEDAQQVLSFFVEFFEACYECGYDQLAEFFDLQLTDIEYFKRWNPMRRLGINAHSHPMLATVSRVIREFYLTNDGIDRVDQWFAHATKRMEEFNQVETTQTYTMRPLEPIRKFYYQSTRDIEEVEAEEVRMQQAIQGRPHHQGHQQVHHQEVHQQMIYEEDDILTGEVVEEEIIGHEIEGTLEGEEIVEEMTLQEGEELIYEEIDEIEEEIQYQEEEVVESTPKVPPHRMRLYQQSQQKPAPPPRARPLHQVVSQQIPLLPPSKRPRILKGHEGHHLQPPPSTPPATRDTTKSVVRGRKKRRDRFAQLRDCPPEVMRAIAAHAIAYDGRKKEQRPFMYVPGEAKLSTSATPVVPTPDMTRYGAPPPRRLSAQQIAELQQQRRLKRDQQWAQKYQRVQEQQQRMQEEEELQGEEEELIEVDDGPYALPSTSPSSSSAPPSSQPQQPSTSSASSHHPQSSHYIHRGPAPSTSSSSSSHPPSSHYIQQHEAPPPSSSHQDVEEQPIYEEDEIPIYEDDQYNQEMYAYPPDEMVVHHEEVHMEYDDSQPCTSASLYR